MGSAPVHALHPIAGRDGPKPRLVVPVLLALVLALILASCSKDGEKTVLGPAPGPDPTVPADTAGWFVNGAIGSDDSMGTKTAPFETIEKGISAAYSVGRGNVFVAAGVYTSPRNVSLHMRPDVNVFGGYNGTTWQRNPSAYVTEYVGPDGGGAAVLFFLVDSCTIDGFTIRKPDRSSGSAIGVAVSLSVEVVISNNIIIAGNGGNGLDGTYPGNVSSGDGGLGEAAGACPSTGGAGGTGPSPGGKGGDGQLGAGSAGSAGSGSDGIYGVGGAGGILGSPDGKNGANGREGTNGADGAPGDSIGILLAADYEPSHGGDGSLGTSGTGGGGGGGGYGDLALTCGGAGGGGGAGGRPGLPGTGGRGGSGSFGIVIGRESTARVLNNRITTGKGGDGGSGGEAGGSFEGSAGTGGAGGIFASKGGKGGDGGHGGFGGYGGGGGGGPSIGIAEHPTATATRTGNTVTLGTPGIGGKMSPYSPNQVDAKNGIARDYYKEN